MLNFKQRSEQLQKLSKEVKASSVRSHSSIAVDGATKDPSARKRTVTGASHEAPEQQQQQQRRHSRSVSTERRKSRSYSMSVSPHERLRNRSNDGLAMFYDELTINITAESCVAFNGMFLWLKIGNSYMCDLCGNCFQDSGCLSLYNIARLIYKYEWMILLGSTVSAPARFLRLGRRTFWKNGRFHIFHNLCLAKLLSASGYLKVKSCWRACYRQVPICSWYPENQSCI